MAFLFLQRRHVHSFYTVAAFYVACEEESKDIFYDEATWPEGAELRDWYYKS